MSTVPPSVSTTFDVVYKQLLSYPPPLLPPAKPCDSSISHRISSLLVHPTLEAALHLLNHDLPSAHFLVRHMQAAPKFEGMFLHGILHRIEGDYDNARAWYGDVAQSDVFTSVWKGENGLNDAREFIQSIEDFNTGKRRDREVQNRLEQRSLDEIQQVVIFCVRTFGKDKIEDASGAWKQPSEGKVREMGQEMVLGDKGYRKF